MICVKVAGLEAGSTAAIACFLGTTCSVLGLLISGNLDGEASEGSSSKFALQIDREFFRGDCDLLKEAKGEVDPANEAKPRDGLGDPKDADG